MRNTFQSILILGFIALSTAHADDMDPWLSVDVTGNWYELDRSGHGLQIELIDLSRALVAWYAFDIDGRPLWLFGVGDIGVQGGDLIEVDLYRYEGTGFPPDFDPDEITTTRWGSLEFLLTGCDTATISYQPEDAAFVPGELELVRLTRIDGTRCPMENVFDQTVSFNLDRDRQKFEALFLDYWEGEEEKMELEWGHEPLPDAWSMRNGIRISGTNRTDDLMMVLMRPLDGLEPDTTYRLELEMQFATNVPSGCVGVGGSPGESVFVRLGASGEKPGYVLEESGTDAPPMRRPSIDLGQQSQPGEFALAAGDMANGLDDEWCTAPDRPWRLKRVSTAGQDFEVTSDENGRLWIYGLSDSGFEATTTWYMTEFVVRIGER